MRAGTGLASRVAQVCDWAGSAGAGAAAAPPNCRAVVFMPLALANMFGGADRAAAADTPVVAAPSPVPASRQAGSQKKRNAGCSVRPKASHVQQAPNTIKPKTVADRGPPSFGASRPATTATMEADSAPGVLARPARSSE